MTEYEIAPTRDTIPMKFSAQKNDPVVARMYPMTSGVVIPARLAARLVMPQVSPMYWRGATSETTAQEDDATLSTPIRNYGDVLRWRNSPTPVRRFLSLIRSTCRSRRVKVRLSGLAARW